MSDDPATRDSADDKEIDPGQPIDMLSGFEYETSTTLLDRIRRAIHRRTAISQIASFSWTVPFIVLLEFWLALADTLFPKTIGKDQRK